MATDALQFLILTVSGWLNRRQQRAIEYLEEENHILREKIGNRRIRFTDKERHMTLNNATPNSRYQRDIPEPLSRDAKILPLNIEKRVFKETRITAYRLKPAA